MTKDVFGKALLDFHSGNYVEDIITYSSLDEKDIIALPYLFRSYEIMPKIEQLALEHCLGNVLDVGAGAGSHSLYLQKKGYNVTALDNSPGAISVCQSRGLKNVVLSDFMRFTSNKFDTLLMLMNGIGLVGSLAHLDDFLNHAATLLNPSGFILLDSSDIIYMFETENGGFDLSGVESYYGEVKFQLRYKGEKSDFFDWLYIDFDTLCSSAEKYGYHCELLFKGNHYDYLAKLHLNA